VQEFVLNRRSLTPPTGIQGILAQRRGAGGARREISARLTLRSGTTEYDGWALNISRGGIRVVIEGRVHLGQVLAVEGYDADNMDAPARRARVVWSQDEPDGSVVGMEFLDADDSMPPPSVTPKDSTVPSAPEPNPNPDPEPEPDSD
jgi:hypothetical protein